MANVRATAHRLRRGLGRHNLVKTFRILSLGAGVQSTTIALMIARKELPPIDAAIFADTQEEPKAVYEHLHNLVRETKHAFPTYIESIGSLGDNLIRGIHATGQRFVSIPAFTKHPESDNADGITRRQCTKEYKTELIERTIRRKILGLKPRQRFPKDEVHINQLIGLSFEESGRVLRVKLRFSHGPSYLSPVFPLWELCMTRGNCLEYLEKIIPYPVPKSACTFCPYHSNVEWRRIKQVPEDWNRACQIDDALRVKGNIVNRNMDQEMFVHRSCVPLREANLSGPEPQLQQLGLSFSGGPDLPAECTGMCGV